MRSSEASAPAVILIGHDMGLMAQSVDRIGVMYAGRPGRDGPVADVFASPRHPYTRLLIRSVPSLETRARCRGSRVPAVAAEPPPGCPFHPRCPDAMRAAAPRCPEPRAVGAGPRRRLPPGLDGHGACSKPRASRRCSGAAAPPQPDPGRGRRLARDRGGRAHGDRHRGRERQRQDDARAPAPRHAGADAGRSPLRGAGPPDHDRQERRHFRRDVQAIFQDPFEVYNPVLSGRSCAGHAGGEVRAGRDAGAPPGDDRGGPGGGRASSRGDPRALSRTSSPAGSASG